MPNIISQNTVSSIILFGTNCLTGVSDYGGVCSTAFSEQVCGSTIP
uniref:Uncharacterized protein n=1 Tax=Anguilla anguilla TaxID=7936 RepID=A0A0E9XUD1_ANGAN